MTFAARETSTASGLPYEMYLFTTATGSWFLTSADEIKTYNGATYTPTTVKRTQTSQGQEAKSGEVRVSIPRDHAIAALFIGFIPATPLFLTIYRAHDGDTDTVVNFTGRVMLAKFGDTCEMTCAPEQQLLQRPIPGPMYQAPCNRILYSTRCGVNKALFAVAATLSSVASDTIQSAAFASKPDGWFTTGYIENGFERRMIINHVGNTIVLLSGMPSLHVGSPIIAYAGCNLQYNGDCVKKFNNGPNFLGFEWIPGINPFNNLEG